MPFDAPPGETSHDARLLRTVDEALRMWSLTRTGRAEAVPDSISNDNFRVPTGQGIRFVRLHKRNRTRERLEREHRVIAWLGDRGVPVVSPIPSSNGDAIRSVGGRLVAIFPWLDVSTHTVPGLPAGAAAQLGDLLGRIQSVLRDFYERSLDHCPIARPWDTELSIQQLSRVDDLIRYYPAPGEWRLQIQEMLRFKLGLLESPATLPYAEFADMPVQPCHGDFHERNVLLDGEGSVAAVVDWEKVGKMPPLFELMQSLTWLHLVESADLEAFVRAYARHMPVDAALVGRAVDMWWQASLHNTWALTSSFVRGDHRADRFFAANDRQLRLYSDSAFRRALAERIVLAAR